MIFQEIYDMGIYGYVYATWLFDGDKVVTEARSFNDQEAKNKFVTKSKIYSLCVNMEYFLDNTDDDDKLRKGIEWAYKQQSYKDVISAFAKRSIEKRIDKLIDGTNDEDIKIKGVWLKKEIGL